MSRKDAMCPSTEINPKRQIAKAKRKFGQKHLGVVTPLSDDIEGPARNKQILDQHAQARDPLFKIKGIERYRRCNPVAVV